MEYMHSVKESDNPGILKFSKALSMVLKNCDVQHYYTQDGSDSPYFKIAKNYKKESETDPDVHYIFVDIDDGGAEYSLFGNFAEDHFTDPDECALIVSELYSGKICEAAFVSRAFTFAAFVENTGDPEQNVNAFSKGLGPMLDYVSENQLSLGRGHMHIVYATSITGNLIIKTSDSYIIPGVNAYLVSAVFAEHPEYYVIQ